MKQKKSNYINLFAKFKHISLALLLAFVYFFAYGFVNTAKAACSYNITGFTVNPTVIAVNNQITMNMTINRQGTTKECLEPFKIAFLAKAKGMGRASEVYGNDGSIGLIKDNELLLAKQDSNFNGALSKSLTGTYTLTSSDIQKLVSPNLMQVFVRFYVDDNWVAQDTTVTSSIVNVTVSGSTGAPTPAGAKNISVNFEKATYANGNIAKINMVLSSTSNVPDVEVVTYVNDKETVSVPKSAAELKANSGAMSQLVEVSSSKNFHDGTNFITVKMFQRTGGSRGLLYAQGSGQVQATGIIQASDDPIPGDPSDNDPIPGDPSDNDPIPGDPSEPCENPNDCLYNPLPEDELTHAFLVIIQGFLAIVGIWAVIFIIIGAFQMVGGAGNEEAIMKAKKTITWAVLGLVVALLSFSIVAIVQNLLQATPKATDSSSSYIQKNLS